MAPRSIAVAGAGIGGLAFAALAARAGHSVTVYDQFEQPSPIGSGLVIQPVGQAVLHKLGAAEAFEMGAPITRMQGQTEAGRLALDVRYNLVDPARFGLAIHRASLFDGLHRAARHAGAQIVSDHPVTGREGQRLRFAHGGRSDPADVIVDAAGARSPLSPLVARPLAYGAIWGTVPWPAGAALPTDQLSQRYRAAHHMVGVLPIGRLPGGSEPLAAVFWSLGPGDYERFAQAPLDTWKAQASALWPEVAPFLSQIQSHQDMTHAVYAHGTLRRPIGQGIAHIGDAAHRASPQLGQGANMALLDAAALAAALDRNHHLPDALLHYAKLRRGHVALYQAMSAAFTPLYQSGSRVLPWLRDHVLMPVSQTPPVPRLLSRLVCGDLLPPLTGPRRN